MTNFNNHYFEIISSIYGQLTHRGVPVTMNPLWGGYQLRFHWCNGDVIMHPYSYYNSEGMVESMGFPWDEDDVSIHTPSEMIELIVDFYNDVH